MTRPTKQVEGETFARDRYQCVAPGPHFGGLEWGHREASGHGGRGVKAERVRSSDGVSQCSYHNAEAEASLQQMSLAFGHKIKRFRGRPPIPAHEIPYFDSNDRQWYLPSLTGSDRFPITQQEAELRLTKAGNLAPRTEESA